MDLKPKAQIFSKEKFIIATLIHTNGHNRERLLCLPKVHLYLTALHIDRGKGGSDVWHHQEKLVFPVPASRIQQLIELRASAGKWQSLHLEKNNRPTGRRAFPLPYPMPSSSAA